jgi:peptidoglycan/LPS O-acetylase OafA/YrhL
MVNHSNRVFGLDVVRSVAILCVLACHWLISAYNTPSAGAAANCLATYGVDLFFVLSGYLIGGILIRDAESYGMSRDTIVNFWRRRWYRTLPNYYAYLLIAFAVDRPWKFGRTRLVTLYPVFLQNFAWNIGPFYIASWSLAIEDWFYLLFPLLIVWRPGLDWSR